MDFDKNQLIRNSYTPEVLGEARQAHIVTVKEGKH
jgi:hypothetical protein